MLIRFAVLGMHLSLPRKGASMRDVCAAFAAQVGGMRCAPCN